MHPHPFAKTWHAANAISARPFVLVVLVATLLVLGGQSFKQPLASVWPVSDFTYSKDFAQDYLIARAVAAHGPLYVPLRELARTYLGLDTGDPNEPAMLTPHPPTLGLLLVPIAALDYPAAATLWLGFEVVLVALAARLVAGADWGACLATFGALLAWHAVRHELVLGQVMLLILVLLAGARRAWHADRLTLAGALLGATLLIKPLLVPMLAVLAVRREWRMLASALGVTALGWLAAGAVVGLDQVGTYVFDVLPATRQVGDGLRNLSVWTVGARLGVPELAPVAPSVLLALLLFVAPLFGELDATLCLAAAISLLVSPLAWDHYLVVAVMPLAFALAQLHRRNWPRHATNLAIVCLVLLVAPAPEAAALAFGGGSRSAGIVESLWLMAAAASVAILVAWVGRLTRLRAPMVPT